MTQGPGTEAFGAAAEEAARLVDALGQWLGARSSGRSDGPIDLGYLNSHLATGAKECSVCPLCRVIALARRSSPELAHRVDEAMAALAALAQTALDDWARRRSEPPAGPAFETIDID